MCVFFHKWGSEFQIKEDLSIFDTMSKDESNIFGEISGLIWEFHKKHGSVIREKTLRECIDCGKRQEKSTFPWNKWSDHVPLTSLRDHISQLRDDKIEKLLES